MSTDKEIAEKFGFESEEEFVKWITERHEEHRVRQLKAHRFRWFAGLVTKEFPCHCECGTVNGDPNQCEHDWDGEWVEDEMGGNGATCSGCGKSFFSHMMKIG